MYLCNHQTF